MCVELATGKLKWKESRQSTISSPIIADGKIIALEKKGSDLVMIDTDTKAHRELGKTRIKAMWCPFPGDSRRQTLPADGRQHLLLRPPLQPRRPITRLAKRTFLSPSIFLSPYAGCRVLVYAIRVAPT